MANRAFSFTPLVPHQQNDAPRLTDDRGNRQVAFRTVRLPTWILYPAILLTLILAGLLCTVSLKNQFAESEENASEHESLVQSQHESFTVELTEIKEKVCTLDELLPQTHAKVCALNDTMDILLTVNSVIMELGYSTFNKTCAIETLTEQIYAFLQINDTTSLEEILELLVTVHNKTVIIKGDVVEIQELLDALGNNTLILQLLNDILVNVTWAHMNTELIREDIMALNLTCPAPIVDLDLVLNAIADVNSTCQANNGSSSGNGSSCPDPCPDPPACNCDCSGANLSASCNQGLSVLNDTACDDGDPCTADSIVDGVCYNRRLPIGTPCQHCTCFTNDSTPTCNKHGQCVASQDQHCIGNCAVHADCPDLGFVKDPAFIMYTDDDQVGLDYHDQYCDKNQSVCIYVVKAILFKPYDTFTLNDCPTSRLARNKCLVALDPDHPLFPCMHLEVNCATTGGTGTDLDLYCLWHFKCASPVLTVFDYEVPGAGDDGDD